jgi:hypothetical protein
MRRMGFALALAVIASVPLAHAEESACMDAHRAAQRLRKDQKLLEAREQLVTCAGAKCPGMVQTDCAEWLGEIRGEIPSVIVSAKDEGGHELSDVSVSVDGKRVAERLDGRPIELNPGAYRFRYEREGQETIEAEVVLKTGVGNRVVEVVFPGGLPEKKRIKTPVVTWVLLGTGTAAFASFAYFGLSGRSDYEQAEDDCYPSCTDADKDPIRTKLLIADISLIISLASFAGAGYFHFTRPYETVAAEARRTTPRLQVRLAPGAGFASVATSF